jgi:3-dehydroquinate dehydratase II
VLVDRPSFANFTAGMRTILIINGPNLNMLGLREPSIYGDRSMDDIITELRDMHSDMAIEEVRTNEEGVIVSAIQQAQDRVEGIVLNAGGYSHTSVAIRDAITAVEVPVVEVHLSNLLAREPFRHVSLIGGVCRGSIMGFGAPVYAMAVRYLLGHAHEKPPGRAS